MKFLNNLSIKKKIISIILIVNFLTLSVAAIVVIFHSRQTFRHDLVNNSIVNTKLIGEYCIPGLVFEDTVRLKQNLIKLDTIPYISNAIVYNSSGKLMAAYHRSNHEISMPVFTTTNNNTTYNDNYFHIYQNILYKSKAIGAIYIRISLQQLHQRISWYTFTIILLFSLAIAIAFLLAYYFQRIVSHPILRLANITRKITNQGDYSVRITCDTNDEIGELYDRFNTMLAKIEHRQKERDKALQELSESEERFKKIAASAQDGIILMNPQGNIVFWNKAAERIFGYTFDEVKGENLHRLLIPTDYLVKAEEGIQNFIKTGEGKVIGQTIETKATKSTGEEFEIELSVSATRIQNAWNAVGIVRDITARKQYENNLKTAKEKAEESNKLKSAFLANVSHEIRTPMNAIVGFTDLMQRSSTSEKKRNQFMKIVHRNGLNLLKLVEDILDISKIDAKQMELSKNDVSLNTLMSELYDSYENIRQIQEKHLIELRWRKETKEKTNVVLNTDGFRLRQIMSKLIDNALKFTETGYVEFGYQLTTNSTIRFYVTDTGIGLEKEKLDAIFDYFRQADLSTKREYGGSGLGLAIVKGLVELMGGNVLVNSVKGSGSSFSFELPYSETESQKENNQQDKTTDEIIENMDVDWSDKIILIVEDEVSNYELLEEALRITGAKLLWAKDGKPAIDLCKSNSNIDLILMDIQMPKMNGYEATREIKALRPDIPVIAQTAFAMSGEYKKAIEAGCTDYIMKPIQLDNLYAKLKKYFG